MLEQPIPVEVLPGAMRANMWDSVKYTDWKTDMTESEIREYISKLTAKMYVSFVLWIVIVVIQFFVGICTAVFYGYGVATLCLMVYNLIGCIRYYRNIQIIKKCHTVSQLQSIVAYFENSIPVCWVFMFLNLVLGGVIGFVGNLYDLLLAYSVRKIKDKLYEPELFNQKPFYEGRPYEEVPEDKQRPLYEE